MTEAIQRDEFFLTTKEVGVLLRADQRTVQKLIERKELGAIRVGSDYRIPRPALEAYLRRQATSADAIVPLELITNPSSSELRARIEKYEQQNGMTTSEFLARYHEDEDAPAWSAEHHRWAGVAEALGLVAAA